MVSHRGSPTGGTASLLTFPDLGLAVAVAANVTEAKGVHPFALQVAEAFGRLQHRRVATTSRQGPAQHLTVLKRAARGSWRADTPC